MISVTLHSLINNIMFAADELTGKKVFHLLVVLAKCNMKSHSSRSTGKQNQINQDFPQI